MKLGKQQPMPPWIAHCLALLAVAAATGLRLAMDPWLGDRAAPFVTFNAAVVVTALLGGWKPAILATIAGGLACDYFITPPRLAISLNSAADVLPMALFIATGLVVSILAGRPHSNRRLAEEWTQSLREGEERFKALAAATFEGIAITEQGRYGDANEQLLHILGYSREDIAGREVAQDIPPEDRDRVLANIREGRESHIEHAMFRKDGARIIVEAHGRTIDYQGRRVRITAIRDITERKRAEETLRQSEERLRLFFEHTAAAVAMFDREMRYIAFSQRWLADYGLGNRDILGRSHYEVFPEIPQRWKDIHQRCLAGATESCEEDPFPRSDGRTDWVRWEIHPWRRSDGEIGGITMFTEVITERKRAEQALAAAKVSAEQAREAAEAANKAKDKFLAVLSHELRNPLSPVLTTASLLQNDPRFDAYTREQLEVIRRNAELEARLIDDLLDVTRIERGKVELDKRPVELGSIIRRATEVCLPDIEARKLEFGVDAPDGPYVVEADAARLQQVFWNLIRNAVKFTPAGGCVGIRCHRASDGFVVVAVSDSGEGIEPAALGSIFNAFEQAGRPMTRQFGGLGLGLTISRAMVEMHGGTITAYSVGKGQGATFTVRLPLLPTAALPAAPPTPQASPQPVLARSLRILLVEDHGDTARIMRMVLMAAGHEVEIAADVAGALKLAGEQPFDLLLSDLGLPDGNGWDLMRALRARGINLPGIALSGYGQEQDVQMSRAAGFAAHMVKPVSLPRLEDAIAQVIGNGACVAAGNHQHECRLA